MGTEEDLKNVLGLVLFAYDFADASRMVDLFTREHGRVRFVARGAKRDKSKAVNLTQPFVVGSYQLVAGRTTYYFKDGHLEQAHYQLRASVRRLTAASFACEALAAVLPEEGGAEPDLFDLMLAYFAALEKAPDGKLRRLLSAFLFKLTALAGFRPVLGRCLHCAASLQEPLAFDLREGGMVCALHAQPGARPISTSCYQILVSYIQAPLAWHLDQAGEEEAEAAAARIALAYLQEQSGKNRFRSLPMLQRLGVL